jgi:hypothetical protein
MNQQLLPEPKHSVHTLQWLCKLHLTVFFRHNITALSVSFTTKMMLCTAAIQTQLHEQVWFWCCLTMRRTWGGAPSCMNKSGSGAASQCGGHEVVPHHAWASLIQGLPHNAENMRWCPIMRGQVWLRCCLTMRRTWGGAPSCMNKSGSGTASQWGEHEVVPHHAWTSLVQVLPHNAENMRWCHIMHGPHELSSMKRHMFQEYW